MLYIIYNNAKPYQGGVMNVNIPNDVWGEILKYQRDNGLNSPKEALKDLLKKAKKKPKKKKTEDE
jgi:hypothetical protein